jgi:hypothetical protein
MRVACIWRLEYSPVLTTFIGRIEKILVAEIHGYSTVATIAQDQIPVIEVRENITRQLLT